MHLLNEEDQRKMRRRERAKRMRSKLTNLVKRRRVICTLSLSLPLMPLLSRPHSAAPDSLLPNHARHQTRDSRFRRRLACAT
jgi:hypothetical protein